MDGIEVTPQPAAMQQVDILKLHPDKPKKTAQDWVRDMRMSADVNKTTTGVETDKVTPDLLLATSAKLLGISRREQQPDPKDSLEFQRFYGPAEYFAEHVLRDGSKVGRNLLWKATNRGNLDFMQAGVLDQHVSDVFYDSNLAQMVDGSSPLETVDASYKTTRIGEGGVSDVQSAPEEMRTVQPSYFGYLDPVRCYSSDTELMTETGWKCIADITVDDKLACLIDGVLEYHNPTSMHAYDYTGTMYGYHGTHISYLVTPNHRMLSRYYGELRSGKKCAYNTQYAEHIHGKNRIVNSALHKPRTTDESQTVFHLPCVTASLDTPQVYGMPPKGANLKNVDTVDIVDFAEYIGWWLSEGSLACDLQKGKYRVDISQDPVVSRDNYMHIKALIERLPFGAHCPAPEDNKGHVLSIARKQLYCYLAQFGKCEDKFIPDWIFTAPLKARKAFRYAMLQGDGRHQRHLCTKSKRLADDFARLQFELGESVKIVHETEKRIANHPGMWIVHWHTRKERLLAGKTYRHKNGQYFTEQYDGKVYCPSVPGELVYCRRGAGSVGFWCYNSPESMRVGLDMYMTKHCMKGSDGKLYQKFIDAKTGKEVLLDSVTAAKSVVACPEMMEAKTKSIFALGGPTGVRIVPRNKVDYYLPRPDDAYSMPSNMVTMPSAVKEMRLLMGCLHPMTNVLVINKRNELDIVQAKNVTADNMRIPGCTEKGEACLYDMRNSIAKFPQKKKWFKKVVLTSGRTLITSFDHKWPVIRDGKRVLVQAQKLAEGDIVLRTTFKDIPNRRTFMRGVFVNKDVAVFLGCAARSMTHPEPDKIRIVYFEQQKPAIERALERLKVTDYYFYANAGELCLGIRDPEIIEWMQKEAGTTQETRRIPSVILSSCADITAAFLDAYTADKTLVGIDGNEDMWILEIPNLATRDGLAVLFARLCTDTLYRDAVRTDGTSLALKLVETDPDYGDMIEDSVKSIIDVSKVPIMIDIDINDNMYAVANGVVTHNSKYPLQAVSLDYRETPLVRGLDEASGKDMATVVGKYLGAQFAKANGTVTAVRKDRIDVLYDDSTKGEIGLYGNFPLAGEGTGAVSMYSNFPMNAKGFIHNKPVVKTGQPFKKGQVLASSNYTDDNGVSAIGTNLRSAWLSWKGGTYEDAAVISESAAKKLTSTTMYKTAIDLDKTVSLGKQNYQTWKPSEFSKEQMESLDDNGVIKPGSVLVKGDPMILAVQTTEPSPGTMGKRILTDVSEKWEHDKQGVVTDVVKTRKGVKVFVTITAPAELGDKITGLHGNKCYSDDTEVLTETGFKLFKDLAVSDKVMQVDENGVASFVTPIDRQVFDYSGDMLNFKSTRLDILVTPDHRMAFVSKYDYEERGRRVLSIGKASDLLGKPCYLRVETANSAVQHTGGDADCFSLVEQTGLCPYNGKVYCVTVPTGMLLVRRNGKVAVCGNCEISQILPDDQMPQTKDGKAIDVLWSPLGIISRTNQGQLYEALLGKVAKKTGKPEIMPAFFKGDLYEHVSNRLKENHISADEDLIDPETGKVIPGVLTGYTYTHKLKHLAESKMSARGTAEYTAEGLPGGSGFDGSKRFGGLEQTAMVGHDAFNIIMDSKLLRGQSNSEFWRSIRTGDIPTIPGEPLVHKKFFAHLIGSGVNVRKTQKGISCFSLTNDDIKELAGPRELRSRDTYEAKNFRPIDGGLFGQDIFGINGDKWGYIKLDEPMPNPVMEDPLAKLLRMSEKDFVAVAAGKTEVQGMKNASDIKQRLAGMDLEKEAAKAKEEFKNATMSKKDAALKRYVAIERMRRQGVSPDQYMLDRIPVLPPVYRPVSTHNGLTMVADSNYLYAQLLDARDDMREAQTLPDEYKQQARENLYKSWKELTGLYEPENVKLKNKNIQGLLKWALGSSPKWSAFQRKVVGATVDTVGRGVVIPNPRLKLNELGIPVNMAFGMMAPFVERALVKRGYTPVEAMKAVKKQTQQAKDLLLETMKTHPVLMNRAPSLHKLSIMAFNPVLVPGHAIHVHPSIVVPFNMDFDGDQANIHVPVSDNAREEARKRMFPERNLIAMKNRQILYKPEKEYQQGLYIATRIKQGADVRPRIFRSVDEARDAHRQGLIDVDDPIIIQK